MLGSGLSFHSRRRNSPAASLYHPRDVKPRIHPSACNHRIFVMQGCVQNVHARAPTADSRGGMVVGFTTDAVALFFSLPVPKRLQAPTTYRRTDVRRARTQALIRQRRYRGTHHTEKYTNRFPLSLLPERRGQIFYSSRKDKLSSDGRGHGSGVSIISPCQESCQR